MSIFHKAAAYKELYADEDYCYSELAVARDIYTNKDCTAPQWDAARKGIGFILFYSSEDIKGVAQGHLYEMQMREPHMELRR